MLQKMSCRKQQFWHIQIQLLHYQSWLMPRTMQLVLWSIKNKVRNSNHWHSSLILSAKRKDVTVHLVESC